jgi:ATP-dependent DNA helicase RecQ/Werner syndrome ATP-dependent helicase
LSPTIIYTVTRDEADTVASFLQQRFMAVEQSKKEVTSPNDVATSPTYQSTVIVEAYHAGMDPRKRHDVHVRFLTGRVHVVVATVAFGMGIDMPNIRKVVHWGPPKTVEDYYQQVGRAGRDGLQSECIMYCSPSEFDRYLDDFYLPEHPDARLASIKSTKALKSFALDKDGCRRKALLDFFQQDNNNAPFGDRCGTCDNCLAQKQYGNDTQRNFSAEIRLILTAVSALRDPSLSSMEAVLAGKIVDGYRYERGVRPTELQSQMVSKRKDLPKTTQSVVVLKGLVPLIVQKGLLEEATKTSSSGAFTRTWTVFSVTPKGQKILGESNTTTPSVIMLPVPDSIREAEHQQKLRREQTLRNLTAGGVNLANIPSHELEEGDGDAIRAFTKWSSYVATQEKLGRDERALKLKQLLSSVESWRSDAALKLTMSPVSVLPEQIMLSIVYTAATLTPGIKIEKSSLLAAGVRTRELDSLLKTLNDWIDSCVEDSKQKKPVGEDCEISDDPIVFPNGVVQPAQQWQFAVYKPNKKTGKATWEFSYDRFQLQKESPQTIAMSPSNGRPIQVSTVVGHILDGLLLGRPVDMYRLTPFCHEIPRRSHWIQLDLAAETTGIDVRGDPAHSGVGGGLFRLSDLLRPIMGDEFIDAPKEERSDEDKVKFGQWCNASKWYLALKRAGIEPAFGL